MPSIPRPLLLVATAAILVLLIIVNRQEPRPEPAAQTAFPISTATCADISDLYNDAVPAPGKDPDDLAAAQDEVLYFVIWVHGYLSGRGGIDLERRPMNRAGIEAVVGQIAAACKDRPEARFLDAAGDID
jgi:hypothetical protein